LRGFLFSNPKKPVGVVNGVLKTNLGLEIKKCGRYKETY
jgi:hypothetical protein